jgi:hypothetical protein
MKYNLPKPLRRTITTLVLGILFITLPHYISMSILPHYPDGLLTILGWIVGALILAVSVAILAIVWTLLILLLEWILDSDLEHLLPDNVWRIIEDFFIDWNE